MSDQKIKADAGKPKLSLVPTQIIWDIAEVREYGNNKYPEGGPDNWKQVELQRYIDAMFRHFLKFIENPYGKDAESGIEHYKHMACNMAFICDKMKGCNLKLTADKISTGTLGVIYTPSYADALKCEYANGHECKFNGMCAWHETVHTMTEMFHTCKARGEME